MKKILIIEDDTHINQMMNETLAQAGYVCTSAYSGTEGLLHFDKENYDLIILDLMLPGMAGEDVLKQIRTTCHVPVIILSAKDELDTKVDLLTLGANDYMTKPFAIEELQARVLVQLRNTAFQAYEAKIQYRGLCYDPVQKQMTLCGEKLAFTAQELKIMELFLRHPGKVFSKNEIYEYAWETCYLGEDKTIHVHISNIRQKIKQMTQEEYIETVWGLGFKLL